MSDSRPLVSVIIPAYNAAVFIGRTLDSVLSQSYRNLEVIVVDDGSVDATADLVQQYADADSRVKYLKQKNAGVAAARNYAIANSNGEFIAPIDSDDVWFPEKIERQVSMFLEGGESVGLVYTWWVGIDQEDRVKGLAARWNANGLLDDALLFVNFVGNASVPLFRKKALDAVGGYSVHFLAANGQGCEDWDLTLRVAEKYHVRVAPEYLMGYRQIAGSMSDDWTSMAKSYDMMIDDLLRRRPDADTDVLNWSRSHFCRYIAAKAYMGDAYSEALRWLRKSVVTDPYVLLPLGIWKLTYKCVLKWALSPIINRIWPDKESWLSFRQRTRLFKPKLLTMEEMITVSQAKAATWAWRPWKPYDIVMRKRWLKLSSPDRLSRVDGSAT